MDPDKEVNGLSSCLLCILGMTCSTSKHTVPRSSKLFIYLVVEHNLYTLVLLAQSLASQPTFPYEDCQSAVDVVLITPSRVIHFVPKFVTHERFFVRVNHSVSMRQDLVAIVRRTHIVQRVEIQVRRLYIRAEHTALSTAPVRHQSQQNTAEKRHIPLKFSALASKLWRHCKWRHPSVALRIWRTYCADCTVLPKASVLALHFP